MPFSIRPFHHFPMHSSVTYNAGPFLKLPLAYALGFGSLITLLVLSSEPVYAKWVSFEKSDEEGKTAYVDKGTIRRKGDQVKMWHLFVFNTAQTDGGLSFLSITVQTEWDCAEERHRSLAFIRYSGNMRRGKMVNMESIPNIWEPVAPDSLGQRMLKVACGKK
jgi:surface-adhesin protein E